MAKALDIAKDLFNLAKGKGLEKPRAGTQTTGQRDNDPGAPGSSPGSFNVGSFVGAMQQANGFARANRYLVTIDTPPGPWVKSDTVQQLQFFCDNINLPGASLIPIDHKRNSIGPFDRRPSAIIPSGWDTIMMLPVHRFRKSGINRVWMDSMAERRARKKIRERTGLRK